MDRFSLALCGATLVLSTACGASAQPPASSAFPPDRETERTIHCVAHLGAGTWELVTGAERGALALYRNGQSIVITAHRHDPGDGDERILVIEAADREHRITTRFGLPVTWKLADGAPVALSWPEQAGWSESSPDRCVQTAPILYSHAAPGAFHVCPGSAPGTSLTVFVPAGGGPPQATEYDEDIEGESDIAEPREHRLRLEPGGDSAWTLWHGPDRRYRLALDRGAPVIWRQNEPDRRRVCIRVSH